MAIKTRNEEFAGLDTRIHTPEIYPSSRLLSSITGVQVQPNKAIVGDNAFAHEAGIHQDGVLKAAITYEIMTPESIGRASNELVLGKHSGRHAFRDRLAELGLAVEGDEFERAFKRFKDLADAKKVIYNEDLEAIVADSVQSAGDRFLFETLILTCGSYGPPNAKVVLDLDGARRETEASGVGPVDAIFRAIANLTETSSELRGSQGWPGRLLSLHGSEGGSSAEPARSLNPPEAVAFGLNSRPLSRKNSLSYGTDPVNGRDFLVLCSTSSSSSASLPESVLRPRRFFFFLPFFLAASST